MEFQQQKIDQEELTVNDEEEKENFLTPENSPR